MQQIKHHFKGQIHGTQWFPYIDKFSIQYIFRGIFAKQKNNITHIYPYWDCDSIKVVTLKKLKDKDFMNFISSVRQTVLSSH